MKAIAADPDITGAELSARIVDAYVKSYRDEDVTQSAMDLDRLDRTAKTIDALAKALTRAIKDAAEFAAVAKTLNATQRFDTADFIDLGHFCQELAKRSKSAAVKNAAKAVGEAIASPEGFVVAEGHRGTSVARATGVSIYFPRGPVNKAYRKLDFAKSTAWSAFLDAFHKA